MDLLILAGDLVQEVDNVVHVDQELKDVMDIFKRKNIEYIPVLGRLDSKNLVGQLSYRKLMDYIDKQVVLRQQALEV